MVGIAGVEETAIVGVSQGATGARETGLWTTGVVTPRPKNAWPPNEVDEAGSASGSSALCAWGGGDKRLRLGSQWRKWLELKGLLLFTGRQKLQWLLCRLKLRRQVRKVKPAGDEPLCVWLVQHRVAEGSATQLCNGVTFMVIHPGNEESSGVAHRT